MESRTSKRTQGRIDFAIQIAGEFYPDNQEALIQMATLMRENNLWEFFLEKLEESGLQEKKEIISFFEKL